MISVNQRLLLLLVNYMQLFLTPIFISIRNQICGIERPLCTKAMPGTRSIFTPSLPVKTDRLISAAWGIPKDATVALQESMVGWIDNGVEKTSGTERWLD